MIRVALADDHHLVRQGIRLLLEKADDMEVVGEAADGKNAIQIVTQLVPDVVILDVAMPILNGIEVTEQIRSLKLSTHVIILSMYDDETLVRRALQHGATGYLLKRSVSEELILAVRAASRNEAYLSPSISNVILTNFLSSNESMSLEEPLDKLSPRERQILQLLAEGYTNSSIAQHLSLSSKTVEKHRANVMLKLNVQDIAGLIRKAIKYGVIFPDQ